MPVQISWDNSEQTILYVRYEGRWTWEEFYQAAQKCQELSATVPDHMVYIIADMVGGFVPQGAPFLHTHKVINDNMPNMGFIVVVTGSSFIEGLMNVSSRIIPRWRDKYRAAGSVDEARLLIATEIQKWSEKPASERKHS